MTTNSQPPRFYVTDAKGGKVRVAFWPADIDIHVTFEFPAADALRLARRLTEEVDRLPRIAEASDLGLVAA